MITLKILKDSDSSVLHEIKVNENEFIKISETYALQIELYKLQGLECSPFILYPEPEE